MRRGHWQPGRGSVVWQVRTGTDRWVAWVVWERLTEQELCQGGGRVVWGLNARKASWGRPGKWEMNLKVQQRSRGEQPREDSVERGQRRCPCSRGRRKGLETRRH